MSSSNVVGRRCRGGGEDAASRGRQRGQCVDCRGAMLDGMLQRESTRSRIRRDAVQQKLRKNRAAPKPGISKMARSQEGRKAGRSLTQQRAGGSSNAWEISSRLVSLVDADADGQMRSGDEEECRALPHLAPDGLCSWAIFSNRPSA